MNLFYWITGNLVIGVVVAYFLTRPRTPPKAKALRDASRVVQNGRRTNTMASWDDLGRKTGQNPNRLP
jgi:hypothetical protein